MPDGVLISTPDQGIRSVTPEHPLGIGLTVLASSVISGHRKLTAIIDGLRSLGRHPAKRQAMGRFDIQRIEDWSEHDVASKRARTIQSVGLAHPIDKATVQAQVVAVLRQLDAPVPLHFHMPLRCSHGKHQRKDGHCFFDETNFPVATFLNRLRGRLRGLGWPDPDRQDANANTALNETSRSHSRAHSGPQSATRSQAKVVANELVWLDVGHGTVKDRKTLGGVVGSITLSDLQPIERVALVLGQYVRIGENTRFGFGAYSLQTEGASLLPFRRSESLLSRAFASRSSDQVAAEMKLPSGVLDHALGEVRDGAYRPEPHFQVRIPKSNGDWRVLSIPSRRDRAIQRVILPTLNDSIDGFLEASSMAYRRGLGRTQAARAIQRAHRDGFHWAVKADFLGFFDHVSHTLLRRRLAAYLADPETEDWVMQCVQAGMPATDEGLPTGAPLSPLLANLFLDRFDEHIQATGARLVRYADDFVVLCRSKQRAEQLFQQAKRQAEQLQLQLNADKTRRFEINDGFDFLGFRFSLNDQWETLDADAPVPTEELHWQPAQRTRSSQWPKQSLPGESQWDTSSRQATVIIGPDVQQIKREGKHLVCELREGGSSTRMELSNGREWIVVGEANVEWSAVRGILKTGSRLTVLDVSGRQQACIASRTPTPDAKGVTAQTQLHGDAERCLVMSKELIASKIHNHAVLQRAYRKRPDSISGKLFALSRRAGEATDAAELLGVEGVAAAIWYGNFADLLGKGFEFRQRVAPDASDPVNVLLNYAQTILHRWLQVWIEQVGLVPTLGVLHHSRPGHATLASDLQEPLRHQMDRAVIEATRVLSPRDFVRDNQGPFPIRIRPRARAQFLEIVHKLFAISVAGARQHEPIGYLRQGHWLARQFRGAVLDVEQPFRSFWHPTSSGRKKGRSKPASKRSHSKRSHVQQTNS